MRLSDSRSYEPDSAGTQLYLSFIIPCTISINRLEIEYCCVATFCFGLVLFVWFFFPYPFCLLFSFAASYGEIDSFHQHCLITLHCFHSNTNKKTPTKSNPKNLRLKESSFLLVSETPAKSHEHPFREGMNQSFNSHIQLCLLTLLSHV